MKRPKLRSLTFLLDHDLVDLSLEPIPKREKKDRKKRKRSILSNIRGK